MFVNLKGIRLRLVLKDIGNLIRHKNMCVSSDMPKNIRVRSSEKSLFFLRSDCQTVFQQILPLLHPNNNINNTNK